MTLEVVTRAEWGAAQPRCAVPALKVPVSTVYQHHDVEGDASVLDAGDRGAEAAWMRRVQAETMGRQFCDYPYSVAVMPSGRVYEGRDLDPLGHHGTDLSGATLDHNATSLAIVWPGNMMGRRVTDAQVQGTADIIALAVYVGHLTPVFAYDPHQKVFATACPGTHGLEAMPWVLAAYATSHGAPVIGPPSPAPSPAPAPSGHPLLTLGDGYRNTPRAYLAGAVDELQRKLRGGFGQSQVAADGAYGNVTKNAVVNAQRFAHIGVDGVCGPQTWGVVDYFAALRGIG